MGEQWYWKGSFSVTFQTLLDLGFLLHVMWSQYKVFSFCNWCSRSTNAASVSSGVFLNCQYCQCCSVIQMHLILMFCTNVFYRAFSQFKGNAFFSAHLSSNLSLLWSVCFSSVWGEIVILSEHYRLMSTRCLFQEFKGASLPLVK